MDDVLTYTNDSENFKEEKIDSGRAEMDEKLAQYKREAERRARIEAESNREGRAARKKKFKWCLAFRRSPGLHVTTAPNLTKQIQIFRLCFLAFFSASKRCTELKL